VALDHAYEVLLPAGASNANKLRTVLAPLRAVLNHAAIRKWCDRPAFEIPTQNEPRVAFLRPQQASALIQAAAPHLRPLLAFLLFTGARMTEALELDWADVDLFGSIVVFRKTKNRRERHYQMPPAAVAALSALEHREGHVFLTSGMKNKKGEWVIKPAPYYDNGRQAGGQIKTAWKTACKGAGITGFTPHDLRHTWATWHYCRFKDLLRVRDDGGWKTADQVEIYAHKMPDAYLTQIESMLAGRPAEPIKKEA
jgi:integrase